MAEEIDLEKCYFRNFSRSVTLTLDWVEVILVRICGRGLPDAKLDRNLKTLLVDGRTDGRTPNSVSLLGHRPGDDPKMI